jgi:O-antigen/teichoic acid export membrane protein
MRRGLRSTLGTTFAIQALGFVSGALVARMLGVESRGLLAALVVWTAIVANLGDLGGPVAYAYLAAKGRRLDALAGNALVLALCQSVVLSAAGVPVLALVLHRYPGHLGLGVALLLAFLPLNLVTRYLNAINQGRRDFGRFNAIRVTVMAAYVAAVVTLWASGARSVGAVVAAVIASNAVVTALALAQRFARPRLRPALDWRLVRDTFRYGPRAHIGNLTPVDSMQLDLAVVVLFLGARDAGLYAIAISAAMIVRAQGTALGMVALPTVASARSPEAAREAAGGIFRLSLLLSSATAAGIALGAPWLVPAIYGAAFAPAVPIVQILVAGVVAASLRQVLGDCLRGFGRPVSATIAEVASWVVALGGFAVFVPLFGSKGAAVAVTLAYAAALAVSLAFARGLGLPLAQLLVPRRADLALPRRVALPEAAS